MIVIKLIALTALLLIRIKGDNSNGTCDIDDVIQRNILSINLTIADQKTEICALKARLERIERLHDITFSTKVQNITSVVKGDKATLRQIFNGQFIKQLQMFEESRQNTIAAKKLCTDGWVQFQRQCYFFSQVKSSWDDANTSCADMSGRLAIVDDEQINIFIRKDTSRFVRYWIGGKTEDNIWVWAGTGSAFKYTAWCPEQPDGSGALCLSFLKLVHSVPSTCCWTDRKCKYRQGYICQRPIANVQLSGTGNG